MNQLKKSEYLQIRVSKQQKEIIKSTAKSAGVDMSTWVLQQVLHSKSQQFLTILSQFNTLEDSFIFARLHDFLMDCSQADFEQTVSIKPISKLSDFQINYTIAMVCHRAYQLNCSIPNWINDFPILHEPYFATSLKNLRLHLLINSPIAFKQRNIFIDSTLGDRV